MKPSASWLHNLVGRLLSPCPLGCQGGWVEFSSFGHCQWLRPEEQMWRAAPPPPKRRVWSVVNLSMGLLPSCLASLASKGTDERQQPYARTDGRHANNNKCTTRLLCVWWPPLSQKGFWSLYRIIIKLMPNWAWNRSLSWYLGKMSDWTSLCAIYLFTMEKPSIGSSQHRTHVFRASLSLNN